MSSLNARNSFSTGMTPAHTGPLSLGASAALVNRTRRVVRERAETLHDRRSRVRCLWIPIAVSSTLVLTLCAAVWLLLDQYDLTPSGIPDASSQLLLWVLWFFPVTAIILALAWFHRIRNDRDSNR